MAPPCRACVHIVESRFDDDVRQRAVAALGDIGGDDTLRPLVTMLVGDFGDPRVRAEAAWALGKRARVRATRR